MFYIFLSLFHISEIYTWAPSYFWLQSRKTCKVIIGSLLTEGRQNVCSSYNIMCVGVGESGMSRSFMAQFSSWYRKWPSNKHFPCTNVYVLIVQFTSVLNFSWLLRAFAFLSFFLTLLRPDLLSHAFIKKTSEVL